MWSVWLLFCDSGFHSVCTLMDNDRGSWKFPDARDWLMGKLSLVLMGGMQKKEVKRYLELTGKFGLGVQNEAGQKWTEFCQENALFIANTLFQQHKRRLYTLTSPDGQHQNQTDYILCSKDGEALYSQQKQIMNSLLPNSDWNWRKSGKPLYHSGMT